jgi:hypothetical protein
LSDVGNIHFNNSLESKLVSDILGVFSFFATISDNVGCQLVIGVSHSVIGVFSSAHLSFSSSLYNSFMFEKSCIAS